MSIPRLTRDCDHDAVLAAIDDAGAVIVEDLFDAGDLHAITVELQPHVEQANPDMEHVNEVMQTFYRSVCNVTGLAGKSPAFVDAVLLHPLPLATADAILGPGLQRLEDRCFTNSVYGRPESWPISSPHGR